MKKKKFLRSILSLLLCVSLLAPALVFSAEDSSLPQLSEDEVPAILDVEEMRAKGHVKRMYGEETKFNEVIFLNADGSKTAYLFGEAVKYEDKEGKTQDKSYKIKSKDAVYENEDNDLVITYSRELENGIRFRQGDWQVEILPLEIDKNVTSKVVNQSKKHQNDFVEYKNAFGNHTVLKYTQELNGYKEEIVLEKKGEKDRFSFRYLTYGAAVKKEGNEVLIVKGETTVSLGEILMWDNAGQRATGRYEIKTVKENEEYVITLDASEFLARTDLVYPVTVDPIVTNSIPSSASIMEEVTIFKGSQMVGTRTSASVYVGNMDGMYYEDELWMDGEYYGDGEAYALFRFPNLFTSSAFFSQLKRARVSSIQLHFAVLDYSQNTDGDQTTPAGGYLQAYMSGTSQNWSESNISWSQDLETVSRKMDQQYIPLTSSTTWYNVDISYAVYEWYKGAANRGITLVNSDMVNAPIFIASSEHASSSVRPYLTYSYNDDIMDGMVFRLKHVASGKYATVEGALDKNYVALKLQDYMPFAESDKEFLNRSQMFRLEKQSNGSYLFRAMISRSGYYRRMDIAKEGASTVSAGMLVGIHAAEDLQAQQMCLIQDGAGENCFEIQLNSNTNLVIGTNGNSTGSQLHVETRSSLEDQTWLLEPAYDYHQYDSYYKEQNITFYLSDTSTDPSGMPGTSSSYGYRYINGSVDSHSGADLGNCKDDSICAPFDGVVIECLYNTDSRGYCISIKATDPKHVTFYDKTALIVVYMHIKKDTLNYAINNTVSAGDIVGVVGGTGGSVVYSEHLHVSIITDYRRGTNDKIVNAAVSSNLLLRETMDPLVLIDVKEFIGSHGE